MSDSLLRWTIGLAIVFMLVISLEQCNSGSVERNYEAYCGSCHLVPDPASIPKPYWSRILPDMAARLGLRIDGYDPFQNTSLQEALYMRGTGVYPEAPLIDTTTWYEIQHYIMSMAPDTVNIDNTRITHYEATSLFEVQPVALDTTGQADITSIAYDDVHKAFIVGGGFGRAIRWPTEDSDMVQLSSPIVSDIYNGRERFITEVGYIHPSQVPRGIIHRVTGTRSDTIFAKLYRPVFTELVDFDLDGDTDLLVCEFGNLLGQLSLLVNEAGSFRRIPLLEVPGTIKVEVTDMNNDGLEDILVLASQGNEGVYLLTQESPLDFRQKQIIKFPPQYGTSWFELLDYDKDGDQDIVTAHGDNADLSIFPKDFHGIRLFLNDNSQFREAWFYPIFGSTRVMADDFDEDGDEDFMVMSYFPEPAISKNHGLVYLENEDPNQFEFQAHLIAEARQGRWLVMDKGDPDLDGDTDILVGSFTLVPDNRNTTNWTGGPDLLFLENKTKSAEGAKSQ